MNTIKTYLGGNNMKSKLTKIPLSFFLSFFILFFINPKDIYSQVEVDKKGNVSIIYFNELKLNGNVKSVSDSTYGSMNSSKLSTSNYYQEFDQQENLIFYKGYTGDHYVDSYKYSYDKDNKLIERISFNQKGEIARIFEYEYNMDGKLVLENNCKKNRQRTIWTTFSYFPSGKLKEMNFYFIGQSAKYRSNTYTYS